MAGLFAVIWFLCVVVLGLAARQVVGVKAEGDEVLLSLLQTLPGFMRSLVGIALLGVIMSSLDSLLNSGGVAFSEDVVAVPALRRSRGGLRDRSMLTVSRVGIVAISAVGCIGSLYVHGIVDGLLTCYAMWGPAIIPSLFYILLAKEPRSGVAIASTVVGIVVPLGIQFGLIMKQADPILVGMASSVGVLVVGVGIARFSRRL